MSNFPEFHGPQFLRDVCVFRATILKSKKSFRFKKITDFTVGNFRENQTYIQEMYFNDFTDFLQENLAIFEENILEIDTICKFEFQEI